MSPLRIAFGYRMRSGKDTSVDYLVSTYGGTRATFATPLYEALYQTQDMFKFPRQKDRKFLQFIGTDWARAQDCDVFVNLMRDHIRNLSANHPETSIFVSDLRFINEFELLQSLGFVCVKIVRPTVHHPYPPHTHDHASEVELDSVPDNRWDFVIANDGSLDDLYKKLDDLVDKVRTQHHA